MLEVCQKNEVKSNEPLKMLFKDEVRRVGKSLGIDKNLLSRHPFQAWFSNKNSR